MARIDSAYAYYMTTYAGQQVSRYDAHKKSDLRKVYNRIVKTNKEAPLFKIPDIDSAKKYAIDIKENAKSIQNVVASLSGSNGDFNSTFQKKIAISSKEDKVGVEYVDSDDSNNSVEEFEIEVRKLATPQINTGQYLANDGLSFAPGSYSFDLNTTTSSYEFQFNVNFGEKNLAVLQKLARLVNNSNLGIDATLLQEDNKTALSLISHQTGLSKDEDALFSISPGADVASMKAMDLLQINQINQLPSNSDFSLNGNAHSSLSNTFTINNAFELTLKDTTDEPVTIGFKASTDAVADNIQTLLDAYNGILDTAKKYTYTDQLKTATNNASGKSRSSMNPSDSKAKVDHAGNKLLKEMSSLARQRRASLEYIGLLMSDDGKLSINKDVLTEAIEPDRAEATFNTLNQFKDALSDKADNAAIDPMNYVNKVIVAYKNPGHNFNTPYVTSMYSGLMMDYSV